MGDKFNVIKQMTKDCERDDCELVADTFSISNSAGASRGWTCNACKRQWSVRHSFQNYERTTYDKNGKASEPRQIPPIVSGPFE